MMRNTWRGVPGVFLNEWSGHEIIYQRKIYDAVEVEDALYDIAREDMNDDPDDDQFNSWLAEHCDEVYDALDEIDPISTEYNSKACSDTVVKHNGYGDPYIIAS